MAKIGVQAMMLRDSFKDLGAFETLRKVNAIGYNAVEVSQIPMTPENVAELDRSRSELGMDIAALSVAMETPKGMPGDSLKDHFDKIVEDAKRLDAKLLRIGMLPFPAMKSIDAVVDFAKQANEYAERLQEQGLGLYYHNHHIEFAKFDGTYMLDIIAENSPAMGMEIDVHWVQRGGLDPVRTLEKYAGRTAMVHLKDYRIGELPETAFGPPGNRGLQGLHGRVQGRGPVRRSGRGQPGLPRHHPGRPGRRRPVPAGGAGRTLRPDRLGRPADLLRQPRGHGPRRTFSKPPRRTRRITT